MEAHYDPVGECLYIKFRDGDAVGTRRIREDDDMVMMDYNVKGEPIGVEFIGVRIEPYNCDSPYCGGHVAVCPGGDDEA